MIRITDKARTIVFIIFVVLSLLTAAMIFMLSHQDATQSGETSMGVTAVIVDTVTEIVDEFSDIPTEELVASLDSYIRVLGHFFGFFALNFFVTGSLFTSTLKGKKLFKLSLGAGFTLCYAVFDEIHQLFIPGRAFQVTDILTDLLGGILGGLLLFAILSFAKRLIKREN